MWVGGMRPKIEGGDAVHRVPGTRWGAYWGCRDVRTIACNTVTLIQFLLGVPSQRKGALTVFRRLGAAQIGLRGCRSLFEAREIVGENSFWVPLIGECGERFVDRPRVRRCKMVRTFFQTMQLSALTNDQRSTVPDSILIDSVKPLQYSKDRSSQLAIGLTLAEGRT